MWPLSTHHVWEEHSTCQVHTVSPLVRWAGEAVPEAEQQPARSVEQCDNTPVIDNLPESTEGGGEKTDVSCQERSKYEEEIVSLYKQLDDKVGWVL